MSETLPKYFTIQRLIEDLESEARFEEPKGF